MKKFVADLMDFSSNQRSKTAWAVTLCLVAINLVWLRWAYLHNNWSLADLFLITDVSFVSALLGLKTVEKMRDNSKKAKEPENKTPDA